MRKEPSRDFYEIQRRQCKKSLFLFAVLILFYFLAIGLISLAVLVTAGLFVTEPHFLASSFLTKLILAVFGAAVLIAFFHFYEARKFGAQYILKRLEARPPDSSDRYHQQFANTVEEMRIASGLPKVKAYVIPAFATNSLALIEADGTPAVAVTEGLLADFSRDELQAVAAHELAHISRGDAFYVTLVCSLANFLERIREAMEPEDTPPEERAQSGRGGAPPLLIYVAVAFSSVVLRLLSMLLSREREILADAAAVEISRNPLPLARSLYKAHLKSTLVGDFSLTYSPLFIVAPDLTSTSDGFFDRLFNSHPPLMKRIKILAEMAKLEPAHVIEQVWKGRKLRDEAKGVLSSFDELRQPAAIQAADEPKPTAAEQRIWLIQDPNGQWKGPFCLEELLFLPYFTALKRLKNIPENVEALGREFPQVRLALERRGRRKPVDLSRQDCCPRCRIPLTGTFYEGVEIKTCQKCGGKLVDSAKMERVLLRKEFDFSAALLEKARIFNERFLLNPVKAQRKMDKDTGGLVCPNCGYKLLARPYTYQYFIPVHKCLSCYKIWFDADELEILQILIEKKA